jgi:hypothetical protein
MLPLFVLPCAVVGLDPDQEPVQGIYNDNENDIGKWVWLYNIAKLVPPSNGLTSLSLNVDRQEVGTAYWLSLALHTQLQSLQLAGLSWSHFGGIIAMSSCRQLTKLPAELCVSDYAMGHAYLEMQVWLMPVSSSLEFVRHVIRGDHNWQDTPSIYCHCDEHNAVACQQAVRWPENTWLTQQPCVQIGQGQQLLRTHI